MGAAGAAAVGVQEGSGTLSIAASSVDAVLFDMGGVFTLPAPALVREVASSVDVALPDDDAPFHRAHYVALADHDVTCPDEADIGAHYLRCYLASFGLEEAAVDRAFDALHAIWHLPADQRWTWRQEEAVEALSRIAASGRGVAIVSNCDGTAEAVLRATGICHVGPGSALEVAAIVDSAVVGVAKPDAGIFTPALEALAVAPDRAVFVGDSLRYDVAGARAAGLHPVHLDPYGLALPDGVDRVRTLGELADHLA